MHLVAFERGLPAPALSVASSSLYKICLCIRKIPLGTLRHLSSWKDLCPLGESKPTSFSCFSAGARVILAVEPVACQEEQGKLGREFLRKTSDFGLKYVGQDFRDEVGLWVRTWRQNNYWCLSSICRGERRAVDSSQLHLEVMRHRDEIQHVFRHHWCFCMSLGSLRTAGFQSTWGWVHILEIFKWSFNRSVMLISTSKSSGFR